MSDATTAPPTAEAAVAVDAAAPAPGPAWARGVRGGALLLLGRGGNIAAQIGIQVLLVRSYSQEAFGSYAYAYAFVSFASVLVAVGLDQALQRLVALHGERDESQQVSAALALAACLLVATGGLALAVIWAPGEPLAALAPSETALTVLKAMALLVPLTAIDNVMLSLFTVYQSPRHVFMRRYVAGPLLRVGATVIVVATGGSLEQVAIGLVVASAIGVGLYLPRLLGVLRANGVRWSTTAWRSAWRTMVGFIATALVADLVVVALFASDAIILGAFSTAEQNALLGSVAPLAVGVQFIFYALVPLFIPLATAAHTRGDHAEVRELYERCTLWIVVFSTPALLVAVAAAPLVGPALFGEGYGAAAGVLAVLATANFVLGVWGPSALLLKAIGEVRGLAVLNVAVLALNLSLNSVLAGRFGAQGVAFGTLLCLVVLSLGKAHLVRRHLGLPYLSGPAGRALAHVTAGVALTGLLVVVGAPVVVVVAVGGAVVLLVIRANRTALGVDEAFPALADVPGVRALLRP